MNFEDITMLAGNKDPQSPDDGASNSICLSVIVFTVTDLPTPVRRAEPAVDLSQQGRVPGRFRGRPNFGGLVLGCIEAKIR